MGIYDNWTYTDLHQLNLDWILKIIKELQADVANMHAEINEIDQVISSEINRIFEEKIADGSLSLSLSITYDAVTEELTFNQVV